MTEPVIHQREDGLFVILDQPDTVFWWATFADEKTARHAFETYGRTETKTASQTIEKGCGDLKARAKVADEQIARYLVAVEAERGRWDGSSAMHPFSNEGEDLEREMFDALAAIDMEALRSLLGDVAKLGEGA